MTNWLTQSRPFLGGVETGAASVQYMAFLNPYVCMKVCMYRLFTHPISFSMVDVVYCVSTFYYSDSPVWAYLILFHIGSTCTVSQPLVCRQLPNEHTLPTAGARDHHLWCTCLDGREEGKRKTKKKHPHSFKFKSSSDFEVTSSYNKER